MVTQTSVTRTNVPGLAALAALALLVFALMRRRFKVGFILLHVVVALGERWSEARARKRIGTMLASRTDEEMTEAGSVSSSTYPYKPSSGSSGI